MALSHLTVAHANATFTPNIIFYDWFTLHWYDDADLRIEDPTVFGSTSDGKLFIIDVVKHLTAGAVDTGKRITYGSSWTSWIAGNPYVVLPTPHPGLWNGDSSDPSAVIDAVRLSRRMVTRWLNGVAGVESLVLIPPY